jgi:DNA-binding HxlR family transcriptional regulator
MPAAYQPKRQPLDPCPIELVGRMVNGKWKARILYQLSLRPHRFGELRRSMGPISQQVLSAQLKSLQTDRLVARSAADPRDGALYRLTGDGFELFRVLLPVADWGLARLRRSGLDWSPTTAAVMADAGASG